MVIEKKALCLIEQGKALHLIGKNELLQEIVRVEPIIIELLLVAAQEVPTSYASRWDVYSRLKMQFYPYVGFEARDSKLATCQHYEALIGFLDDLLPESYENMTTDERA